MQNKSFEMIRFEAAFIQISVKYINGNFVHVNIENNVIGMRLSMNMKMVNE